MTPLSWIISWTIGAVGTWLVITLLARFDPEGTKKFTPLASLLLSMSWPVVWIWIVAYWVVVLHARIWLRMAGRKP